MLIYECYKQKTKFNIQAFFYDERKNDQETTLSLAFVIIVIVGRVIGCGEDILLVDLNTNSIQETTQRDIKQNKVTLIYAKRDSKKKKINK